MHWTHNSKTVFSCICKEISRKSTCPRERYVYYVENKIGFWSSQVMISYKWIWSHPSQRLLNYKPISSGNSSSLFWGYFQEIMCIFYVLEWIFFWTSAGYNSSFSLQLLSLGESEVSFGLHAVKAQAAAMLCSPSFSSPPTYREQTLQLTSKTLHSTQNRHEKSH